MSSLGGVCFERHLYARDLPYLTAQVWTQDLVILVLLVPVLLVSYLRVRHGSVSATATWVNPARTETMLPIPTGRSPEEALPFALWPATPTLEVLGRLWPLRELQQAPDLP